MKLELVFFVVFLFFFCRTEAANSNNTLAFWLDQTYYCFYTNMETTFNTTKLTGKINGTTAYTLFAICNPTTGTPPTLNATVLNYHLVKGLVPKEQLPTDGVLNTDSTGDVIRVTLVNHTYFFNGIQPLRNATSDAFAYVAGASQILNGVFYAVDTILPLPTTLSKSAIFSTTSWNSLGNSFSFFKSLITLISVDWVPPSTLWTIFIPSDAGTTAWPQYQKDQLTTNSANAMALVKNHVFVGTILGYPLSQFSLSFQPVNYITSVGGQTFKYSWLNGNPASWNLNGSDLTVRDSFRSDGLVNCISTYFLPSTFQFAPPTINQYITQFSTFSLDIKQEFIPYPSTVTGMINNLLTQAITVPDGVTLLMWDTNSYGTDVTDVNQLKYHILPGVQNISLYEINTQLTSTDGNIFTVLQYSGDYYFNGVAKVLVPNLQFQNSMVHIIDRPLIIPSPANATCDDCYKLVNIQDDLSTALGGLYSKIATLLNLADFSLGGPDSTFTFIAPDNSAFENNVYPAGLYDRLLGYQPDRDRFLKQLVIPGTFYPVAAGYTNVSMTALDGTVYSIAPFTDTSIVISIGQDVSISNYYPRNNGVFYTMDTPLIIFYATPEPAPAPVPVPEPAPHGIPAPSSSILISFNLVLIIFCLFSVVFF